MEGVLWLSVDLPYCSSAHGFQGFHSYAEVLLFFQQPCLQRIRSDNDRSIFQIKNPAVVAQAELEARLRGYPVAAVQTEVTGDLQFVTVEPEKMGLHQGVQFFEQRQRYPFDALRYLVIPLLIDALNRRGLKVCLVDRLHILYNL
jgi:hypothetical protein